MSSLAADPIVTALGTTALGTTALGITPAGFTVALGLQAQLALTALAVLLAILTRGPLRNLLAGGACAVLGLAGLASGVAALRGDSVPPPGPLPAGASAMATDAGLQLALPLPDLALAFTPTPLGGVFMAIAGGVGAIAAVGGIGYVHGPAASRTGWSAFACFLLGMQLVPAAGDMVAFLLAWETMALASTVLLLADHATRVPVRSAALWYAVLTHLSMASLLAGLGLLAAHAGSTSFAAMAANPPDAGQASLAFVLLTFGFATKAGLLPVHVWLPRAHPEAPSHASAAMSAAMVKMGVYGILLTTGYLLPHGERWWPVVLTVLGAASALYGILQASVTSDLKRLLAYSTTENIGLIVAAIGLAGVLRDAGQHGVADVALVAALLLAVSHAAFKTVLFLGAGAIQLFTGRRDLDDLGGLVRDRPITAWAFGVGAAGACALPITGGFVAEWVLLQALVHADGRADRVLAVLAPLTLGVLALTIGLGLMTFLKAWGIAFLARPRTPWLDVAHGGGRQSRSLAAAQLAGAAVVITSGLAVGPLIRVLAPAVDATGIEPAGPLGVALPAVRAILDPGALATLIAVLAVPVALTVLVLRARAPRRAVDLPWGCGGARTSPRMEYTANSYAEPLVRVFGHALRPRREVSVEATDDVGLHVVRVVYTQQVGDLVEQRAYAPLTRAFESLGDTARRVQNGSIHRYLAFSFVALLVVLAVVTR